MTARKDQKKLIRNRMRKTGESYTAARRHFLHPEEASMTTRHVRQERSERDLSVDHLQLTLRIARVLRQHHVRTIGELVGTTENELIEMGLTREGRTQIRDVLASRGL